MLLGPEIIDWPDSLASWLIWSLVLIAVFVTLRRAGGGAIAVLGVAAAFAGYAVDRHLYIPLAVLAVGLIFLTTQRHPAIKLDLHEVASQALFVTLGFGIYELGRKITEGDVDTAMKNSARVLDFERRLGLAIEPDLQRLVMRSDTAVTIFTRIYSSLYIPVVLFGLIWFLLADRDAFRVLRNALGLSAGFSLLTFWLYPVAPPRLLPDAGIVDLHDLVGRQHGFVNEFAAVPSLHVGWTMLVGYVFFRTYHRRRLSWLAWAPGSLMLVTVVVTGNHYWFDGAIGILYALAPAAFLLDLPNMRRWWTRWVYLPPPPERASLLEATARHPWALFDVAALGVLLIYMIVGEIVRPGFTDYWGYMVAQIAATMLAVSWLTQRFSTEGGLSWLTHLIIVLVTYADTLGTAAGFYDRYQIYDKFTHLGGGAILSATVYEITLALRWRGAISWNLPLRMVVAIGVSLALGAIWEFYEVFGDAIFDTGRHAGSLDTIYDLISDFSGAILAVALLARLEPTRIQSAPFEPAYERDHTQIGSTGEPV